MNIRKSIDYCEMFAALDHIIETEMPQMELYCEIGKAVSQRTEKGAAVAAAEYLAKKYPDVQGFSPRNVRRMRDFYRAYQEHPDLLSLALQLGWTQNIVILEADLSMELRGWYLEAVKQFGWSKAELTEKIAANAHEMIILAIEEKGFYIVEQGVAIIRNQVGRFCRKANKTRHLIQREDPGWNQRKRAGDDGLPRHVRYSRRSKTLSYNVSDNSILRICWISIVFSAILFIR